jgi:hypothetical protein
MLCRSHEKLANVELSIKTVILTLLKITTRMHWLAHTVKDLLISMKHSMKDVQIKRLKHEKKMSYEIVHIVDFCQMKL